MKIEKIKKMQNGKYMITMDNKEKIVTYDEVILNHNLLFNKEVSNELLNELNIDTDYFNIYNKVIKYITTKMRSNTEIKNYLKKLNVSEEETEKIISSLKRVGLINDNNYVRAFIADKMNLTNMGPNKIRQELEKHNIDESIIIVELNKYEDKFIYDKLAKLLVKKIKSTSNTSNYVFKQKILNYFINLGYDSDMINDIFSQNVNNINSNVQNDYQKLYNKLSKKYFDKELEYKIITKLYQKGYTKEEIDMIEK